MQMLTAMLTAAIVATVTTATSKHFCSKIQDGT